MWSFHSQNLLADRHVEPGCHLLYGDAWDAPGPGTQYLRRSTGNSIRSQRLNRVGDHVTVCRIFQGWKAKDECECISDAMKYGSWTLLIRHGMWVQDEALAWHHSRVGTHYATSLHNIRDTNIQTFLCNDCQIVTYFAAPYPSTHSATGDEGGHQKPECDKSLHDECHDEGAFHW